jgi:carboxylate-amine ligase
VVEHPHARRIIDENRWRAKRDGLEASFIDDRDGSVASASVWLDRLLAFIRDDARALGAERALGRLQTLVARGSSAHAQLDAYRRARDAGASRDEAMREVIDWMIVRTAGPLPDAPQDDLPAGIAVQRQPAA